MAIQILKINANEVASTIEVKEIQDGYKNLQDEVEGGFEIISLNVGGLTYDLFLNEEFRINDMTPSLVFTRNAAPVDYIGGNCFFTRSNDEGETISLTEADVVRIQHHLTARNPLFSGNGHTVYSLPLD